MRKIKAFTLIEVMISIFVFSSAMLGFMAFHAHTMAVLFENESTQFAHSLAFNLVDEINAMSYDAFNQLISDVTLQKWIDDKSLPESFKGSGDSAFTASPFNSFGKQDTSGNYRFYRSLQFDTYANKTQAYVQTGSYLSTLYHVDVRVAWPKKENPTQNCSVSGDVPEEGEEGGTNNSNSRFSSEMCNFIIVPLIRSTENYKKNDD